ncbi:MAG: diheme cytochrome c [Gammaproteobacteria bacterium]|nr:diheme cytochrome c [Gammaproteobacteria bacterium]
MMKKWTVLLMVAVIGLGINSSAFAEDESFFDWLFSLEPRNEVKPMHNELYNEECSDCHFPYQAGLLPEASWYKLFEPAALEDHFGDNAELDDETRLELLTALIADSADKSHYKRSKKIIASLGESEAPLRITDVPYIKRKHHDIPDDLIAGNEKVKSLSFCDACHQKADEGIYDDDTVAIPGHGNWTW